MHAATISQTRRRDHAIGHRAVSGFTLIELLIVMVILGLLASLVAPNLFKQVDSAKVRTAESQIQLLSTTIDTFRLDIGRYPSRLDELVSADLKGWNGPYIQRIPLDPWQQPYQYKVPGEQGPYDLYSHGDPTSDDAEPIGNWQES